MLSCSCIVNFMSFCKIIKTCNQKFKILLAYVSLWWLSWCERKVCEWFLGDARGAYRGLPELFHLSWIDQWMMIRFSRDNLNGSSRALRERPCQPRSLLVAGQARRLSASHERACGLAPCRPPAELATCLPHASDHTGLAPCCVI